MFFERITWSARWLVSVMAFALGGAALAGEQTYFSESFAAPSTNWTAAGAKLDGGHLKLAVPTSEQYMGAMLQFNPELAMPSNPGESLRLSFVVGDLGEAGGKQDAPCSARFFLIPGKIPNAWFDPYSANDTLVVVLSSSGTGQGADLAFYRKAGGQPAGYGELLYQAKVAAKQLPLRIGVELTDKTYRLTFDPKLEADKGMLSGEHGLPVEGWQDGLSCGVRVVNHVAQMHGQFDPQRGKCHQ